MGVEQIDFPTKTWMDRELAGCKFRDVRLGKRFRKLLEQLSDGVGESIPLVCQDWANTKAAYRFSIGYGCQVNEKSRSGSIFCTVASHFTCSYPG